MSILMPRWVWMEPISVTTSAGGIDSGMFRTEAWQPPV